MVDHEIATNEKFSAPKDIFSPFGYREKEDFTRFRKDNLAPQVNLLRSLSLHNEERWSTKKEGPPLEEIEPSNDLSFIISELLELSTADYTSASAAKEIKRLEIAYKNNMQDFLTEMDYFLLSARHMRNKLITSLRTFLAVSRGTEGLILGSSVANFAVLIGSLMHKIFRFSWNSKIYLIPTAMSALTFTASLMAFTYMNQTTNDFSKDLRNEIRLLRKLIAVHQKGDLFDMEVNKLFPFGIDLNLIDFEGTNYYKKKPEWKKYLCHRIIQGNIEKDKKLLKNEDFLVKVKLFVESPASGIWWCRMKIRNLLGVLAENSYETSTKRLLSSHENVIYRTAQCIFPVIISWMISSSSPDEIKFIVATLGGFFSALELGNDGSEELANLKRMYLNFEKDFKEIYKICQILDGGED